MRSTLLAALSLGLCVVSACSSDDHGDHDPEVNCDLETRAEPLVIGQPKAGVNNLYEFSFVDAVPSPPARGDNMWTLQITQKASAAPLMNAELFVTPYMPDHGHTSPIDVGVTIMPTAGQYELEPVNLWMPGLWETTIEVLNGADTVESVVFKFCVPS
ncbi:MAG: FixH family protein [Kofleriaceae bacterium]|nr:FixH family protein [Kofleriaceae bacterium]